MATSALSGKGARSQERQGQFIGGLGFDRLMALLSCWFIGGTFLDGWAHGHGFVDNTFFTPWHAALYSGYFATALCLVVTTFINHNRGASWLQAIPAGYKLAFYGIPLFMIGGAADLLWHTLFGFEVGVEPLLSPSHLLLGFTGLCLVVGPLRAAWQRSLPRAEQSWRTLLPALISFLAFFSIVTFFMTYAHPVVQARLVTDATGNGNKSWAVAAILLQAAFLIGALLLVMRRWRLPFGAFTLLIGVNTALMTLMGFYSYLIPGALLAGIAADLLYVRLRPTLANVDALRIFAFCVPSIYYALYFANIWVVKGVSWSIHLWMGSILLAGVVGLFVSYVVVPPAIPNDEVREHNA